MTITGSGRFFYPDYIIVGHFCFSWNYIFLSRIAWRCYVIYYHCTNGCFILRNKKNGEKD